MQVSNKTSTKTKMPKLKKNKIDYHAQLFVGNVWRSLLIKREKYQPNFKSYHFRNMKTKNENYIAWQFLECKKLHALAYFTLLDLYENEKKEYSILLTATYK